MKYFMCIFFAIFISSCCRDVDCKEPHFLFKYINNDSVSLLDKPNQPYFIDNINITALSNDDPVNWNYSASLGDKLSISVYETIDEVIIENEIDADTLTISKYYKVESGCCKGRAYDVEVYYDGVRQCGPCGVTSVITIIK